MSQTDVIDELKNKNWAALSEWLGDFNLFDISQYIVIIQPENEMPIQAFEMILCLIFAEYQKGLQQLLRNDDTVDNARYLESLEKI